MKATQCVSALFMDLWVLMMIKKGWTLMGATEWLIIKELMLMGWGGLLLVRGVVIAPVMQPVEVTLRTEEEFCWYSSGCEPGLRSDSPTKQQKASDPGRGLQV